ncbi:MAG: biotin--[acetyl-CoA-carboxylase] ligase [Phycisphaerales bacterium]|nr:biotin--[acetyl-CoA-carboxylase] ligase [Phycisphaerales bacterium]
MTHLKLPFAVDYHAEIPSTSLAAKELLARGATLPRAIIAKMQTAGVGQRGRAWRSPVGGVFLTFMWPFDPKQTPDLLDTALGLRLGLAVLGSIRAELAGTAHVAKLKLPNDVMIGGRKVAGVLTEVVHGASRVSETGEVSKTIAIVVGVGVNADFSRSELPDELHSTATTLRDVLGRSVDVDGLTVRLLTGLACAISKPSAVPSLIAEATPLLWGVGADHPVTLPDGSRTAGTLLGLTDRALPQYEIDGRVLEVASLAVKRAGDDVSR